MNIKVAVFTVSEKSSNTYCPKGLKLMSLSKPGIISRKLVRVCLHIFIPLELFVFLFVYSVLIFVQAQKGAGKAQTKGYKCAVLMRFPWCPGHTFTDWTAD